MGLAVIDTVRRTAMRAEARLAGWPPLAALDRAPFVRTAVLGLALGAGLGAWFVLRSPLAWGLLGAAFVAAASAALALTARPEAVFEVESPVVTDTRRAPKPIILDLVSIPGGTFLMGSPEDEEDRGDNETQHWVTLSPFLMARTTVTRAQYAEALALDQAPGAGGDDHPVTRVSWHDAARFCNALSEREGLPRCYEIAEPDAEKDLPTVTWLRDEGGYRLPTEAEWEHACRAETTSRFSFGDGESKLDTYAWYWDNSGSQAHPVAKKEANSWGLHDMHGNVWEWCWDLYRAYLEEPQRDPRGPSDASSASFRVLRGGSFVSVPRFLRSAFRDWVGPGLRSRGFGFRCVRRPLHQP